MSKLHRKQRDKKRPAKRLAHAEPARFLTESPSLERRDLIRVAIVFGVALAFRLLFFFLNTQNNPVFYHPIMDGLYHHEWAADILSGNLWGSEVFFRAPLYPYVLALLYKVSGSSIGFAVFFQHLLGTASAVLVYLIARRFFTLGVALLAGLLAALYWPLVYFEGDFLIVTLIVFLNLCAVLFLLRGLHDDEALMLGGSGILFGLSAIARPSILIVVAVLPLFFYLHARGSKAARRAWVRRAILTLAGVSVVILPVLVRNVVIGRDLVPIASQGGVNFYIGNNPQSDGATAVVPGTRWDWWGGYEDAIRMAETEKGRRLKPSEVSNHYFGKGLRFIFSSPNQSLPLMWKKTRMFVAGGERSNNKSIYFFWHLSGLGRIPFPGFWLIGPLGLLGAFVLWRKRPDLWLLYLFTASYSLGVIAFFVNARFRLPVVPVLIIFAAYGACHLWTSVRQKSADAFKAIVVLAISIFVVNYDLVTFRENKVHALPIPHYTLGNAYLKMDDPEGAISEYEEALRIYDEYHTPGFEIVRRNVVYNLGRLYWAQERCSRAVPLLEQVGGNDQYTIMAKTCLAGCYIRQRRIDDAIQIYRDILRQVPGDPAATLGLGRAFHVKGDKQNALEFLIRARPFFPDDPSINAEIRALQSE